MDATTGPAIAAVEPQTARHAMAPPSRFGDKAFEWLEKAYDEHDGELIWLGVDPIHDPVRDDSRFRSLLERLRLTSSKR